MRKTHKLAGWEREGDENDLSSLVDDDDGEGEGQGEGDGGMFEDGG